jgi:tetratricopeptide (TPR) repeat protein
LNRHAEALRSYDQALAIEPAYLDALNNRALACVALQHYAEAIESYEAALSLQPNLVQALFGRGVVLQAMKRHSEAIDSYDKALLLRPDLAEALHNRGFALQALGRYQEAIGCYDQALSIRADYADAYNNRGRALQAIGDHAQALHSYDKALALQRDHADARLNKGLLLLLLGELEEGWALYEWRWKASDAPPHREFVKPLWLGEAPIAGKRLLLHAEQGLGDTIQLCRYAKVLSSVGADVILEVPRELRRLLQHIEGASEVVATGQHPPEYDLHCPLLSVPLACKTTLRNVPNDVPYLKIDEPQLAKWSATLGATTRCRIGVAWSGSTAHRNDSNRSIALAEFSRLFSLPAEFICLQNHTRDADRAELAKLSALRYFEKAIEDFSDTAALIALCDLVICVDTAVAHLAGALAKPLWLLLPFAPDWRWMTNRDDSPWYPTARLFRQPKLADWDSVLESVERELEARLGQLDRPSGQ